MDPKDHPLIKQIRARGAQQSKAESATQPDKQVQSSAAAASKKRLSNWFTRRPGETAVEAYTRGKRWVGERDQRNKRFLALAELRQKLQDGKHVQNRTLQTHLTQEQYEQMLQDWARQQLIRSGSKHKPTAVKSYEGQLKSVQLDYAKAARLQDTGHAEAAVALENQCNTRLQALVAELEAAAEHEPALADWFDRPIAAQRAVDLSSAPRCITSQSKSNRVTRKTKAQVKLDAVNAAMDELR